MTPDQVEQYVLVASDATDLPKQQQANALLNHWISTSPHSELAETLLFVLRCPTPSLYNYTSNNENDKRSVVLFFTLTTVLNHLQDTTFDQRARLRQELFSQLVQVHDNGTTMSSSCWNPTYLRTKVGVLLAKFIQLDFVVPTHGNRTNHTHTGWYQAFDDLQNNQLLQVSPDIFLRTLVALMDDFGHQETPVNAKIKDFLRGYAIHPSTNQDNFAQQQQSQQELPTPVMNPVDTESAHLLKTIVTLLAQSLEACPGDVGTRQFSICILALTALKGFLAWIDLSLILDEPQHTVLHLIFAVLAKGSTTDSPMADAAVVAVECLQELIARGMDDDKKVAILIHTHILETIYAHVDLETADKSPIDVVLEIAKFINRTGLEVFPTLSKPTDMANGTLQSYLQVRSQLLELFFRCLAFDDIDVSEAVIPLAGSLVPAHDNPQGFSVEDSPTEAILSHLLTVSYRQMRYPDDFQFDYEDEMEAEEEMYRTELRKLYQKLIRAAPDTCLQFICTTLAQLPVPLSTAPTPDVEASLRLVYHYCEGIRPAPGMKVVMKNETFCNVLVAFHSSDIVLHPHREVITLYYETAVRYYPLLKEHTHLLQKVFESLTGTRGLQHEHPRVRSRCCYMLLRLVKSVGSNSVQKSPNNKNNNQNGTNVLRPYVETAISGIQGLLDNGSVHLRSEDILNLFETIGLLLGKTGLDPTQQQQYLTQVMRPHVRSIERVLERRDVVMQDPATFGELLSSSIAAIAFLSKGFKKPSEPVQTVLLETLQIATSVLETLPGVESIRNKSIILIQRLIQCIEEKVLPPMPRILFLFIQHCTPDDILDVAQLMNQLCIKFKEHAVTAMDTSLVPFLTKCRALADQTAGAVATTPRPTLHGNDDTSMSAPHQRTEQLSIQKLCYVVLQHVVVNQVTSILWTPTNAPCLEQILKIMSEGAIHVDDPIMKKVCIMFFKVVLEQWLTFVDGSGGSAAVDPALTTTSAPLITTPTTTSSPHPPTSIVQGYVHYVCQNVIPGVLQSYHRHHLVERTALLQDANQWRCVLEFAALLDILYQRLPQVFQEQVLLQTLTNRCNYPVALVETFRTTIQPNDRKSMEQGLKLLLLEYNPTMQSSS